MKEKSKVTHMYPIPGTFDARIKARIAQAATACEAFAQTSMACPNKSYNNGCTAPRNTSHNCCWWLCPKGDAR